MSVIIVSGCLFYFYVVLAKEEAQGQQRPNIIVIMADDLVRLSLFFLGFEDVPLCPAP